MEEILALYRELHDVFGTGNLCESFCENIRTTIQEALDAIPPDARTAIRGGGDHTNVLFAYFSLDQKQITGIFDRQVTMDSQCGYPCFPAKELPNAGCGVVILSSFYYQEEILAELRPLGLRIIDPYEELEKQGIELIAPLDQYSPESSLTLNHFYRKYLESRDGPGRNRALHDVLQAAVELKDFVMVRRICAENAAPKDPLLLEVQAKTENLLQTIRRRIQDRKQKDVMVFWTDAVSYYLLPQMPLMLEKSKHSCFFRRAYTHTPFTHQSLSAIFTKMLPIDDYERAKEPVCRENSPLIQYLEDRDYDIKFIAHLKNSMDSRYFGETSLSASCNVKWWAGLERWLSSEKPCFYIFHILEESHEPNISPDLQAFTDTRFKSPLQERQRQTALAYLDQCLALYNEMAGDTVQVFLSDHGQYIFPLPNWSEERLHAYCFALGKDIPERTVSRFFPYRNFDCFAKWLVEPEKYPLEDVCADEVIFQDTDFYNPVRISLFIRHGIPKEGLAIRGVLNDTCRYTVNALGEETFFRYAEDGTEEPAVLEDPRLRAELQKKCGTNFLDIYQLDRFQHTRKLYEYLKSTQE